MLDEIFDLFDRKRGRNAPRSGGIRGVIGRAISGNSDRHGDQYSRHDDRHDDRYSRHDDRRYRHDDDDDYGHEPNRRRRNDAFDFD